jgi:hypothetical protein
MMLVKMQEPILTSLKATSLDILEPDAVSFMIGEGVRYLLPFFNKEVSVSQAAKSTKVSLAKMRYWVDKMQSLGLIEQTKEVKRKGSPIKYYRSVANEFRVSINAIPVVSLEEMLETKERRYVKRAYQAVAKAISHHSSQGGEWYIRFFLENNNPTSQMQPKQGTSEDAKSYSIWMPLSLSPEQAKNLRTELRELTTRYAQMHTENETKHPLSVVHLLAVQEGQSS